MISFYSDRIQTFHHGKHLQPNAVDVTSCALVCVCVCIDESNYVAQAIIESGSDEMKTWSQSWSEQRRDRNGEVMPTLATNLIRLVSYRSFVVSSFFFLYQHFQLHFSIFSSF